MSRRYSVLLPDGTRHAPVDLPTLNAWATAGQLSRETLLVPEDSKATLAAGTIPGLVFPPTTTARTQREAGMSTELRSAWFCAGLAIFGGFLCFGRFSGAGAIIGTILAAGAFRRREPGAPLALAANVLGLLIAIGWTIFVFR